MLLLLLLLLRCGLTFVQGDSLRCHRRAYYCKTHSLSKCLQAFIVLCNQFICSIINHLCISIYTGSRLFLHTMTLLYFCRFMFHALIAQHPCFSLSHLHSTYVMNGNHTNAQRILQALSYTHTLNVTSSINPIWINKCDTQIIVIRDTHIQLIILKSYSACF